MQYIFKKIIPLLLQKDRAKSVPFEIIIGKIKNKISNVKFCALCVLCGNI